MSTGAKLSANQTRGRRPPPWVLLGLGLMGCAGTSQNGRDAEERLEGCPERQAAPSPLPRVTPEQRTLSYWLKRVPEPDEVLLGPQALKQHSRALELGERAQLELQALGMSPDAKELQREVNRRLSFLRERFAEDAYVNADGSQVTSQPGFGRVGPMGPLRSELRVALADVPIHCGPRVQGFYKVPVDKAFDRNLCSTARAQEPVQLLQRWPNGMWLARTGYVLGWIADDAALSPAIAEPLALSWLQAPLVRLVGKATLSNDQGQQLELPAGTLLRSVPNEANADAAEKARRVYFATRAGLFESAGSGDVLAPVQRGLTRRAVLTEAFEYLGQPYGWGGAAGGRDCSRFLMDVWATFGLRLPRNSGSQQHAGTFSIDLAGIKDEKVRERLIDAANEKGIVLLHMPGHIMLYLGQDDAQRPMAMHSLAEYVEPCELPDGKQRHKREQGTSPQEESIHTVNQVTISDLSLGRGGSRTALIERLDRIVVIGRPPGPELAGVATLRAAAQPDVPSAKACRDSEDARIFSTPRHAHARGRLRVIATMSNDPGPSTLVLYDPRGKAHATTPLRRLGGPPYTLWTETERPVAGNWTAVVGDGERILACKRLRVGKGPVKPSGRGVLAWEPHWRWERDTENLYSAFVEQLFDYPIEEDRTWDGLQVLLDDPSRNLLYNHLGQNEDAELKLRPDCADLPYFLRTYFAWKLRLPLGFRQCSRGRAGTPPHCGPLRSNLEEVGALPEAQAFKSLLRKVKSGVHSGTARTPPDSDETDLYPVALTRGALRPGTVYADPYGHLLVVARWVPQGAKSYGILLAADAQPDGTVGRRRFWRGSFLFTPDTADVGAGFKAWRPLVYERKPPSMRAVDNAQLSNGKARTHAPFSMQPYAGSQDDFYDALDALINPRPLDAQARLGSLVDALAESVARRVNSVNNGEEWVRAHRGTTMTMPSGYSIFETTGPWEDFATPSRDLRLLISIDAVLGFVDAVARHPKRYGIAAGKEQGAVARLRSQLEKALAASVFRYQRTDGETQVVSLLELSKRKAALEMAYNPNDCVEIRWGAPPNSAEYASCKRHAAKAQRKKMQSYRAWFRDRKRPPR